jgi:hypothetical protein
LKILAALIFCILPASEILSQITEKNNLQVFEELITASLNEIIYSPLIDRQNGFIYNISADSSIESGGGKKFFTNLIHKFSQVNKLNYFFSTENTASDTNLYKVKIFIFSLKTLYTKFVKNKFLGEKSVERNLLGKIVVQIDKTPGIQILTEDILIDYKGEIPYENYESFETADYQFTIGNKIEINFIERIIFPAAIIAASAAAILAFFLIRTK